MNSYLLQAKFGIKTEDILKQLSEKYNCNVGQVCISYCLSKGICPLPKSLNESRMKSNLNIIALDKEDIDTISNLANIGGACINSEEVDF